MQPIVVTLPPIGERHNVKFKSSLSRLKHFVPIQKLTAFGRYNISHLKWVGFCEKGISPGHESVESVD